MRLYKMYVVATVTVEGCTLDNMVLLDRGWDGPVVTLRGEIGAATSPVSLFVTYYSQFTSRLLTILPMLRSYKDAEYQSNTFIIEQTTNAYQISRQDRSITV